MAGSGAFAFRHLFSLLPFPYAASNPSPPPPLCVPSSPPLITLSSRPHPTLRNTPGSSRPVSFLLPSHVEASKEEKEGGGLWGAVGPSLPGEVLFACYPAAALANVLYAKPGYYNAQVVVGEDEPEDRIVERFRRAAVRAGVFRECRRRRFFEDKQAELKRRARDAAVRRVREAARLRRLTGVAQATTGGANPPPFPQRGKKKKKKKKKRPQPREAPTDDEEEEDIWELPEGEIPYC